MALRPPRLGHRVRSGARAAVAVGGISLLGMALSAASARSSPLAPGDAILRATCAARGRTAPALVTAPAPAFAPRGGRAVAAC